MTRTVPARRRLLSLLAVTVIAAATALPSAFAADLGPLSRWTEGSPKRIDNSDWAVFLKTYVDVTNADGVNRVRYGAVNKKDRARLDRYIAMLARSDPTTLGRDEAFAYWANLYNALTVALVVEHYPVKSIRDIKPSIYEFGPWKMERVTVNGIPLSLDDIEHGVLRAAFKDPRAHYAVNCASIGCPNLRREPFSGKTLSAALDDAARNYVNHPRGAQFDGNGRLVLSSIYKWFVEDFGGGDAGVIAHLARFAEPELAARLKSTTAVGADAYDWTLNDAR